MKPLFLAAHVIKNIMENNVPFAVALKEAFLNNSIASEDKPTVSALVGCELRHHLLFSRLLQDAFGDFNDDCRYLVLIGLANNYFAKRIASIDAIFDIKTALKEKKINYVEYNFEKLFEQAKSPTDLIPSGVEVNSLEYLSLRFNTPSWLIKMWQKHYGRSRTFKILKANNRMPLQTCRINSLRTTVEEVIKSSALFEPTIVEEMIVYKGKTPLRKNEFYRNFDMHVEKLGLKNAIDNLNLSKHLSDVLVYSGNVNGAFLELAFRYKDINIDLAVPSLENRLDMKRYISDYSLKNITLYEASPKYFLASFSHLYEAVFVLANNSEFDQIRSQPDYLLRFDFKNLDLFIAKQKEALDEAAKFVDDDGLLFYSINTLSPKEGHYLIHDFLRNHQDFSLINEKQYFPYDKYDCALYVASMKKSGFKQ